MEKMVKAEFNENGISVSVLNVSLTQFGTVVKDLGDFIEETVGVSADILKLIISAAGSTIIDEWKESAKGCKSVTYTITEETDDGYALTRDIDKVNVLGLLLVYFVLNKKYREFVERPE